MKVFWLIPAICSAASQATWVGADACARCHPAQFATQNKSHHAMALSRIEAHPLATALAERPVRERNGTEFEYQLQPNGLQVTARQDGRIARGLLEWVFGAGALAFTPVGRAGDSYFEHRVSWYIRSSMPGITLGHSPERPKSPETALGRNTKRDEISRCFGCHATGVRMGPRIDVFEAGVRCERCHGPGSLHVKTLAKSDIRSGRANTAAEQVALCAECHRAPVEALGKTPEQTDPMLVRFAPVGLAASLCYEKSVNLTCLTCHYAHENARFDTLSYTKKCLKCHENSRPEGCAFTQDDCLSCHMKKTMPVKDLVFTDHRIRVYR